MSYLPRVARNLILTVLLALTRAASAFDVGNPWFPDFEGEAFRIEGIYERFRREIRVKTGNATLSTSSLGVVGIAPGISYEVTDQANLGFVRLTYFPVAPVAFQFDLGSDGETNTGDQVLIIGGATRLLLSNSNHHQFSFQFSGHFIPEFSMAQNYNDSDGLVLVNAIDEAYELGAALLSTHSIPVRSERVLQLYYGPRLSVYRSDFSVHSYHTVHNSDLNFSGEAKETGPFSCIIGSRIEINKTISARIEGRLIDEESLSAAIVGSY